MFYNKMSGCEHERYRFISQPETSDEGIYPVQDKKTGKLYLMKVYMLHENELFFTAQAAALGIGAPLITSGICKYLSNTSFLVLDKIVGDDGIARSLSDVHCSRNQLVMALEKYKFLMDNGIYQRDLKGANVMVGHNGEVVIIDYGIARSKLDEPDHDGFSSENDHLTELEKKEKVELGKKIHMISMASLLVESMTFGKYENKYFKTLDSNQQDNYFRELIVETTQFLRKLYNDETIKLNIPTPYHLKKQLSEYNKGRVLVRNEEELLIAPSKSRGTRSVMGRISALLT